MSRTSDPARTLRQRLHFVIPARLLVEQSKFLTRDPAEDMVLVSGISLYGGTLRVAYRVLEFEKLQRSRGGVVGDPLSVITHMTDLERWGERAILALHSHPGCGVDATMPSSIDRDYLSNTWRAGYRIVSGIYSQDGFLRFLCDGADARITVSGRGVTFVQTTGEPVLHVDP